MPAIVIGALVAGLLAAVVGRATMRLKGPYFSIATLGTFVAVREIVRVWGGLTGGGVGLTLPPVPQSSRSSTTSSWRWSRRWWRFTWWLRRTRFGAALVAIREDEIGAETRGIDTTRLKTADLQLRRALDRVSSERCGPTRTRSWTPTSPSSRCAPIDVIMGTMLGGLGTVAGPILGAAALYWLREKCCGRTCSSTTSWRRVSC